MQQIPGGTQRTVVPRRGRWSQQELIRLKELYGLRDDASIARELNRPVSSVRKMAESLFQSERRAGPWTADEVQRLKKYLGATSEDVIAQILGRTQSEVHERILDLGRIEKAGSWTREEKAEFKRIYGTRTDEDLARIFGRKSQEVQELAERYAMAKDKAFLRRQSGGAASVRMPRWREDELEMLRVMYPEHRNLDIAKELGRSVKSIVSKAHNLGLKKSSVRLRQMGRENVSLRYRE